jgi:hypothetical protein
LLETLDSKIQFISTVSIGSTFWFSLPVNENDLNNCSISEKTLIGTHFNELHIQTRLSSTPKSGSIYNIIIVDDENFIRQATKGYFRKSLNRTI